MNTKFQISIYLSPSCFFVPGRPPDKPEPLSKNISLHGPQGPKSPIDQKLSSVDIFKICESENPVIFFHKLKDSLSSLNTVIIILDLSKLNSFVSRCHA